MTTRREAPGRAAALVGTLVAILLPAAAVVTLHRLGSLDWLRIDLADPTAWLSRTPIEDAVASVLRYVALAGAYWLAGSSLLYLLARLSGATRLIDATALLTLPAVRRVTDRLVIGTLAASTFAVPGFVIAHQHLASADVPVTESVDPVAARLDAVSVEQPGSIDLDAFVDAPVETSTRPPAPADTAMSAAFSGLTLDAGIEVVVTEGDHLWALAEQRISDALGRPAEDHEIAPYWRLVIDSNPLLRSGNPDLIYPGEVVVLPPVG